MYTNSLLALSGALVSMVAAVPMADQHHHQHHHHARDYVMVTHVDEQIVTVPVTKTVWIEPGETPPTDQPQGYSSSPDVEPAATSAPAAPAYTPESSSPSAPAAPAYTPESSSPSAPAAVPYSSPSSPEAPAYTPPTSSSTSVYVAPTTSSSTSVYVAPTPTTPTSTYVAPTTFAAPTTEAAPSSSSAAAPAAYSSASSGGGSGLSYGMGKSGTSYTGDFTYYAVGMGACGITNTEDQKMVAVSEKIFDSYGTANPNKNPLCGKWITIEGLNGDSYQAQIWDRCPGCDEGSLDLPQEFFNTCTNNGDGRVHNMKWSFN